MKRITNNKLSELLTGDFLLYPEDGLEDLEMQLKGIRLEKAKLKKKIDRIKNPVHGYAA